ncbi:hypothetical protein ACXR2T_10120 [Leucobacter sp. HY1910]
MPSKQRQQTMRERNQHWREQSKQRQRYQDSHRAQRKPIDHKEVLLTQLAEERAKSHLLAQQVARLQEALDEASRQNPTSVATSREARALRRLAALAREAQFEAQVLEGPGAVATVPVSAFAEIVLEGAAA